MQTPADRINWTGRSVAAGGAGLCANASDEHIQTSVHRYVERVTEVGLEIIGLTDHNLGHERAKQFYDRLRHELTQVDITVFPGFEISAQDIGNGIHFLCLFEPATTYRDLSDCLTQLGLAEGQRWSKRRPTACAVSFDTLLETVQTQHGGLVIAAHVDRDSGVLDNTRASPELSETVATDPRLLAIETARPRSYYEDKNDRLGQIANGRGSWKRPNSLAFLNNSDCKRLDAGDGPGDESFIGNRWTWIKTGHKPSIRSLRQAFLDHGSRLGYPDDPHDRSEHPTASGGTRTVSSLEIQGAKFLADQRICFSPALNTIIGGGGTGKTTILEYLRLALGADPLLELDSVHRSGPGIESTLPVGSLLTVQAGTDGDIEATLSDGRLRRAKEATGDGVENLVTRIPVRFVRQQEISRVAKDDNARRRLIDDLDRDELASLDSQAQAIGQRMELIDRERERWEDRVARRAEVESEIRRKRQDLAGLSKLTEPLNRLEGLRAERRTIDRLSGRLLEIHAAVEDLAESLNLGISTSELTTRGTPHLDEIEAVRSRAAGAVAEVGNQVRAARAPLVELDQEEQENLLAMIDADLTSAEADYVAVAAGLPEAASAEALRRDLAARELELATLDREIEALKATLAAGPQLQTQLGSIWDDQATVRKTSAERITEAAPRTEQDTPYIQVEVRQFGDVRRAMSEVISRIDDRRRFSSDDLDQLIHIIEGDLEVDQNPIELLCEWATDSTATTPLARFSETRRTAISEACTGTAGQKLRRFRPPDQVEVTLFRRSGHRVGTLDDGLSVGQQCVAVLSLLLASGTDPIVIDQPEDDIDNEFIYRELVPLLRKAKAQRQIILVTHNANIPVNGDAELVYALEAVQEDGRVVGKAKLVQEAGDRPGGSKAVGALDLEAVLLAVEEIMEGSKEAFERRRLKYGF